MSNDRLAVCLWFDSNAEEAVTLYRKVFPDLKRLGAMADVRRGDAVGGPPLTVTFELFGTRFVGLNGGPHFRFNEAVSLMVHCEDQAEIDRVWDGLIEGGGAPQQCGWLKDRFGLSWQVLPRRLPELLSDPARASRVMAAMMPMVKLDIRELEAAAEQDL